MLALENLAQGREWHEDATSSSRGRLGLSGGGGSISGGGGGSGSGGSGSGGGVGVICALPIGQVIADYCELLDVYKAFVSGKIIMRIEPTGASQRVSLCGSRFLLINTQNGQVRRHGRRQSRD